MKPFILQNIEFNSKDMIVRAFTNCGVYEYRILPAFNGQKDLNIIRYERGKRVIRSREYPILKNGIDIFAKIRVCHEPTHDDIRALCPIYLTPRFLDLYYDKIRELMEMNKELQNLNKIFTYRLGNVLEDLISVGILTKLGLSKEDVVEALNLKQTWKILSNILQSLDYGIKHLVGIPLRDIIMRYLPIPLLLKKLKLTPPYLFKDVDASPLANMNPTKRLSIIYWAYDIFDSTLKNSFLKDNFKIKINKKLQIE